MAFIEPGDWHPASPPEPEVDVIEDEPIGDLLDKDGNIIVRVYPERVPFGFRP